MSNKNKLLVTTGIVGVVGIAGIAFAMGALESPRSDQPYANPAAVPAPKDRKMVQASAMNCDPCAPKCNPCAAEKCNPCAAMKCNPCAAEKCNPCATKKPCGPCAPKCNPCAAKKCNPCAAKKPCSPCGPCNPCNPCAPKASQELDGEEAETVYAELLALANPYGESGIAVAAEYRDLARFNTVPYSSATHGGRLVNNYANENGAAYGKFEDFGQMPAGAILAKDSFTLDGDGGASPGPLFLMRKMEAGFRPDFGDWEYTLIMPGGEIYGITNGAGSDNVEFCGTCHMAVAGQDHMFFLPAEYRKK